MGLIRYDKRNYLDALKHFQLSLKVYDELYPYDFEKTIPVHFDMGRIYNQLMNYSMALKYFQISLVSSKQFYPDEHEDIQRTYILIGMIYYTHRLDHPL
jgi:tetratricopeptide (TPR) repeat protein